MEFSNLSANKMSLPFPFSCFVMRTNGGKKNEKKKKTP